MCVYQADTENMLFRELYNWLKILSDLSDEENHSYDNYARLLVEI